MSRIRDIVSDLRTFAHPGEETEKSAFPRQASLEIALRLTAHELRGHDVHQEIPEHCFVRGFQNQVTPCADEPAGQRGGGPGTWT